MQTNYRSRSFCVVFLSTIALVGLFFVTCDGRQCNSYRDCLGDYRKCCNGYCRWHCNLSCSSDEQCGSPGSKEEYCCKGKCISVSSICEEPRREEEPVLSATIIAVIAIFGVILIVALCIALRSYWCKCLRICFKPRGSQQGDIGTKLRGGNGFVEFGRESGTSAVTDERTSAQTSISWVGQDVRIVPSKSTGSRHGLGKTKTKPNNVKMILS